MAELFSIQCRKYSGNYLGFGSGFGFTSFWFGLVLVLQHSIENRSITLYEQVKALTFNSVLSPGTARLWRRFSSVLWSNIETS